MAMSCHNELNRRSTTVGRTVESVHKNKREVLNLKDSCMHLYECCGMYMATCQRQCTKYNVREKRLILLATVPARLASAKNTKINLK